MIDGVPISMSPSPFAPHERVITELSRQIANQIIEKKCNCKAYSNLDWIIDNHTVNRPDLIIVCGQQPQRHLERPPSLVCEVLSESTRGRDLTAKRTLCRENDVPNYLIIDPDEKTLLQVAAEGESSFQQDQSIEFSLDHNCQIRIEIAPLFE